MTEALIRGGASVDFADSDGITLLSWAVFRNNPKLAGMLIGKGANVNNLDKLGFTPLHWAANVDFGDTAILELLLRSGADPKARNKEGLTPLEIAVKYKYSRHREVLERAAERRIE
jgi:ankyrin repeat protein